jgi:hypothetical protein
MQYVFMKQALIFIILFTTGTCLAQIHKDFLVGLHLDLIKSNQSAYFQRGQFGGEVNYFLSTKFTATGGLEYWTDNKQLSAVVGARWYPVEEAFVRVRGLVGANDISVGGGWAKPLKENWRFESMADVYFNGQIAIRVGFAHLFLQ